MNTVVQHPIDTTKIPPAKPPIPTPPRQKFPI